MSKQCWWWQWSESILNDQYSKWQCSKPLTHSALQPSLVPFSTHRPLLVPIGSKCSEWNCSEVQVNSSLCSWQPTCSPGREGLQVRAYASRVVHGFSQGRAQHTLVHPDGIIDFPGALLRTPRTSACQEIGDSTETPHRLYFIPRSNWQWGH